MPATELMKINIGNCGLAKAGETLFRREEPSETSVEGAECRVSRRYYLRLYMPSMALQGLLTFGSHSRDAKPILSLRSKITQARDHPEFLSLRHIQILPE